MSRVPREVVALALILVVAAGSAAGVFAFSATPRQASALPTLAPVRAVPTPTALPAVLPGPLDGLPTKRNIATRRPLAFIVDNYSPDARPESGLSRASVVFETVVEGGVTRLMPIYLEKDASQVGPIRSARPYFVDWAAGYGAGLVHAGGSPAALQELDETPRVASVEALQSESQFYRLPSKPAPHNLFSSTGGARTILKQLGAGVAEPYTWLRFHPISPTTSSSPAIHIDFSTPAVSSPPQYAVTYRYDGRHNVYRRGVGGLADTDANTGKQIGASNVVILFTSITPIRGDNAGRLHIRDTGSGAALYLIGGRVIHGRWSKRSRVAALRFWHGGHRPVALNPGQTWVEVVPRGGVRFGK